MTLAELIATLNDCSATVDAWDLGSKELTDRARRVLALAAGELEDLAIDRASEHHLIH